LLSSLLILLLFLVLFTLVFNSSRLPPRPRPHRLLRLHRPHRRDSGWAPPIDYLELVRPKLPVSRRYRGEVCCARRNDEA